MTKERNMWVELLINGQQISIQCEQNETIETVYTRCLTKLCRKMDLNNTQFLYNGKIVKPSIPLLDVITSNDKSRNRLSIIVIKNENKFNKNNNDIEF